MCSPSPDNLGHESAALLVLQLTVLHPVGAGLPVLAAVDGLGHADDLTGGTRQGGVLVLTDVQLLDWELKPGVWKWDISGPVDQVNDVSVSAHC